MRAAEKKKKENDENSADGVFIDPSIHFWRVFDGFLRSSVVVPTGGVVVKDRAKGPGGGHSGNRDRWLGCLP